MRGVLGFVNRSGRTKRLRQAVQISECRRTLQAGALARLLRLDGIAPGDGVLLINELRHRNLGKIRVAHELSTIEKGAAISFGDQVNGISGAVTGFGEIVALENVERFDQ